MIAATRRILILHWEWFGYRIDRKELPVMEYWDTIPALDRDTA